MIESSSLRAADFFGKIKLLRRTRYLTVNDKVALRALTEAATDLPCVDRLFPNVTHLSLGAKLIWDLAVDCEIPIQADEAQNQITQLTGLVEPEHLCVTFGDLPPYCYPRHREKCPFQHQRCHSQLAVASRHCTFKLTPKPRQTVKRTSSKCSRERGN